MSAQKKSTKGSSSSVQPADPVAATKLLASTLQVSYSADLISELTIRRNIHPIEHPAGIASTDSIGPNVIGSFICQPRYSQSTAIDQ
jgi:hypothetical protein